MKNTIRRCRRLWAAILLIILACGTLSCKSKVEAPPSYDVPVLMYHHFDEVPNDSTVITPATFERHLKLIRDEGFNTVTPEMLLDYVTKGVPLPENPVLITMDDGYYSNYSVAYPLLEKYGMKATVFPVGWCIGKSEYKDTGNPIIPHFGFDELREMLDSGVISIGSHTYDMHQSRLYETAEARPNVLPLPNESRERHLAALTADLNKYSELYRAQTGRDFLCLAYPEGAYNEDAESTVHAFGIQITFSTSTDRRNVICKGDVSSLYALRRLNVTEQMTEAELLSHLYGND